MGVKFRGVDFGLGRMVSQFFTGKMSVLSLGCGVFNPERSLPYSFLVGVDVVPEYLEESKKLGNCIGIRYDIRDIRNLFVKGSFDAVVCLDVIEHLEVSEGLKLIDDAEYLAGKLVVFYTPIKWDDNRKHVNNPELWSYGNEYNIHKSLWDESVFITRGYAVYREYPSKEAPEGFIAVKTL